MMGNNDIFFNQSKTTEKNQQVQQVFYKLSDKNWNY